MTSELAAQTLQWWQDLPGWWIGIGVTAGTALGTLGLAIFTYLLARSTKKSVEGANDELTELKAQRELLDKQAEASRKQAQATADLVIASKLNADQSTMARINAYAPLVNMTVSVASAEFVLGNGGPKLLPGTQLSSILGDSQPIKVTLRFDFKNHGNSPALLSFGDEAGWMTNIAQSGSHRVELAPGDSYTDTLDVIEDIASFKEPKIKRIQVTCNGLLHGEVFDTIAWYGWVQPFSVTGEIGYVDSLPKMLKSSETQVVRTYPNLDQPDEMAETRARLLGQEEAPPADSQG